MGRVSVVVLLGGIIGLGRGETNVNHGHGKYQYFLQNTECPPKLVFSMYVVHILVSPPPRPMIPPSSTTTLTLPISFQLHSYHPPLSSSPDCFSAAVLRSPLQRLLPARPLLPHWRNCWQVGTGHHPLPQTAPVTTTLEHAGHHCQVKMVS